MKTTDYIPKLMSAVYENDKRKIDIIVPKIIRTLQNENDDNFRKLSKIYSDYRSGVVMTRELSSLPVPKDKDNSFDLLNIHNWDEFGDKIVLSRELQEVVTDIVKSREFMDKFIELGVDPINKVLLFGEPGVGKTVFAQHLAFILKRPLLSIDLSATISSLLGKTGRNIKEVFDYSRKNNAILLLDEFDAIAKRRDDSSELGELKRIVNVLLKELEEWPADNLIIAASNHPDILDKAIWRRFDTRIEVLPPNYEQRLQLWCIYLKPEITGVTKHFLEMVSIISKNLTPADIKNISDKSLQKYIVSNKNVESSVLENIVGYDSEVNKEMKIKITRELSKKKMTQREIAKILKISSSTVNRYLKKGDEQYE